MVMRIWGGLGNQLFQYAAGRCLAEKFQTRLKLDLDFFPGQNKRVYGLDKFLIEADIATDAEKRIFWEQKNSRVSRVMERIKPAVYKHYFQEPLDIDYDRRIERVREDVYLDGYWQNENYFREVPDNIRQEISLRQPGDQRAESWLDRASRPGSVSLHVRRGDFFTNKKILENNGLAPLSYYEKALAYLGQRVSDLSVFVFSDDIDWCRGNLRISFPHDFVSADKLEDYEELMIMSQCRHNIIANSSFSWWGAWLNQNPDKIVIAPRLWSRTPTPRSETIVPSGWIKL